MLALLLPLFLHAAPTDETLATVDSRVVRASQLVERYKATQALGQRPRPEDLLQDLINDDLLAADGYARKLQKSPAVAATAERARRKVAAERFLEKELYSAIRIDDAQVNALFHETGDSVHLKLVTLATDAEAKAVIERLKKGAKFEDEGKKSLDPSAAAKGGDLGDLSRGMIDAALRDLAFSAPLNQPVGPVKLKLGFGVLVVTGRYIADEKELVARKAQIVSFATEQTKQSAKQHLLQMMRAKHKVVLDEDFLKSTGTANVASPKDAERVIARVGDQNLTYGEVLTRMVNAFGTNANSHTSGASVKRELAYSEIDRLVLEVAAIEAGYGKQPEAEAAFKAAERNAVIAEVARLERAAITNPTRPELEAWLAAHASEYTRPGTRSCSQLVLKSREQAAEVRSRLAKGEKLEDLAQKVSIDRATAARGGLLGTIDDAALVVLNGRQPSLVAAIRGTKPGVVSDPTQTRDGWHLVRCTAPSPPSVASFAEVEGPVTIRVLTERGDAAVRAKMKALRDKARISVANAAVQRVVASLAGAKP